MRMKVIQEVRQIIACKGLAFVVQKHYHQCLTHGWDLEHDVLGCATCRVVDRLMHYCRSSVYHLDHALHQCSYDGSYRHVRICNPTTQLGSWMGSDLSIHSCSFPPFYFQIVSIPLPDLSPCHFLHYYHLCSLSS